MKPIMFDNATTYCPCWVMAFSKKENFIAELDTSISSNFNSIFDGISDKSKIYILDFEGISYFPDRFDENTSIFKNNFKICIVGHKGSADSILRASSKFKMSYIEIDNVSMPCFVNFEEQLLNGIKISRKAIYQDYLKDFFKKAFIENKTQTLESSGLKSNLYFNAKILFIDAIKFFMACFRLSCDLQQHLDANNQYYVIATSITGSVVASCIASLLKIDRKFLVNLGPLFRRSTYSSISDLNGKCCILIADMLCSGSELKAAEAVLNSVGADVHAAAVLCQYRDMFRFPIVNIFDLKSYPFFNYNPHVGE